MFSLHSRRFKGSCVRCSSSVLHVWFSCCEKPGKCVPAWYWEATQLQVRVDASSEWPEGDALSAQNYRWGQCLCGHGLDIYCHANLAWVVDACWHCVGAKGWFTQLSRHLFRKNCDKVNFGWKLNECRFCAEKLHFEDKFQIGGARFSYANVGEKNREDERGMGFCLWGMSLPWSSAWVLWISKWVERWSRWSLQYAAHCLCKTLETTVRARVVGSCWSPTWRSVCFSVILDPYCSSPNTIMWFEKPELAACHLSLLHWG